MRLPPPEVLVGAFLIGLIHAVGARVGEKISDRIFGKRTEEEK